METYTSRVRVMGSISILLSKRWILATLIGSPRETFSEARYRHIAQILHQPDLGHGFYIRSFARFFGLLLLTHRELRQLRCGSNFCLQGALISCLQLASGGYLISEHPAPPKNKERPSIWTSAILTLLQRHPDCKLHIVEQWRWGTSVPKPTGLLALRLPPFIRSMYSAADHALQRPTAVAIERKEDGSFRTSIHKECSTLFCKGVAKFITDQFEQDVRSGRCSIRCPVQNDFSLIQWIHHTAELSAVIRDGSSWLPYQS